jgi:hypothetical protein
MNIQQMRDFEDLKKRVAELERLLAPVPEIAPELVPPEPVVEKKPSRFASILGLRK